MNPEKRLEILEAFASSKPTEFDGFTLEYLSRFPEVVEPIVVEDAPKRTRKKTVAIEEVEPEAVSEEV
jgi:hypothetical protein